jgi:hypothetical protein
MSRFGVTTHLKKPTMRLGQAVRIRPIETAWPEKKLKKAASRKLQATSGVDNGPGTM